ncbi:MAG: ABC transporter substrate-binding protein, partial [Oscillospiraceae bacterium]
MRRISLISLLLCIVFVLSACNRQEIPTPPGESSQPDDSSSAESKTFTLMYCMSDSLNPYASKTLVNNHITNLLYEPLIKLDEHLKPVYALASNVIINENHCVVTIKNAVFSDGTPLTPDDVVYSIKCAMSSDTPYSVSLKNILNCSVASSDSVSIILKKHDPYFVNLLDFPIIKQYSDTLKDENDLEIPPTGVGRYQIDTKNRVLKANAKFYGGEPKIKEILLTNTPDAEAMNHNIEVGRVDAFFSDLSDNKIPKMTGVNQSVHLNRLIYMGINMKNPVLAIHQIRYALSAAINRTELCNKAFFSYAQPANGPFPSFWQDAKGFQTIENINNSNIYIANLKEIGYNSKDVQGFYLADNKTRLFF